MAEQGWISVDADYLKELEEKAKKVDYYQGIIDGITMCKDIAVIPQTDCYMCKWMGDRDVCGRCRNRNLFAVADTPQTDCPWK